MENAMVRVEGLQKSFWDESRGEVRAVDGIDFDCRPGEIFGLLGANGAGKTTTLRMLATILKPTGGRASLNGHDVLAEPEAVRRSLGFFSASTALYPRLTGRETLEFFARINQYPRRLSHPPIRDRRICQRPCGETIEWNEAEDLHRADDRSRSTHPHF
jgi:ABC-type multidrug transport system ATPase subunit